MTVRQASADISTKTEQIQPVSYRLERTVVLVGMMGCGKSAIGKELASRLGVAFLDSDAEIETAANATIAEIFERDGEAFFRRRETEVISRLLTGEPCILSTGGGAFLAKENRELITQKGVSVWLDATLDTLWERVKHKTSRPLLATSNPRQTLSDLLDARLPIYREANVRVETRVDNSIETTTLSVIDALLARGGILEVEE